MDNFTFYNPTKILFGRKTIQNIGKEISNAGIKRILLLAGGGSIRSNGVYDNVVESLKKHGIEWIESWGVQPNPVLSHARQAVELVKKDNLEAILAIGGGSVIDEAKSIAVGAFIDDIWDAYERTVSIDRALPVYTILTISGTCSEMDSLAVLTNEEEKKKWNIGSPLIFPRVSIIDPSVQFTLPWHQTVNGAIDAMSHIMEYYLIGSEQEATLALDESLMRTLISSTDKLKSDPSDYSARSSLAWSASLALNGISGAGLKGGDWSVHRIEHGISALHPEVAHGAGLSIIYPAWIEYMKEYNPDHFLRWAKNVWQADSIEAGIEIMKEKFNKSWDAPVSLTELSIGEDEIMEIAINCNRMGPVGYYESLNYDMAYKILKIAL